MARNYYRISYCLFRSTKIAIARCTAMPTMEVDADCIMNTFGFQFAIGTGSVADRAHHIRGRVVAHCRHLDLLRQFFEGSPVGDRDEAFFDLHDAATLP
jgi:hypothetical protein